MPPLIHYSFLFALTLAVQASSFEANAADQATVQTVVVAPVTEQVMGRDLIATGNVVAWREMPIGAEASGLSVTEIAVDEGDAIEKGRLLARLNSSVIAAQLAQQQAAIAELEATLATAQSDLQRARSVSSDAISAQTREQRDTLVKTTTAKLSAARAVLDEINARLKQTEIVAPAAGLIASRSVTLGQVVQAGTEMFRIIQDNRIEVDALVPEADLLKVTVGLAARIVGPDGTVQQGTVRLVAPSVDARSRLGTVHIALDADNRLKPGMFARVEISTGGRVSLAAPLKALVWSQAKPAVFKVGDDGIVHLTPVVIGNRSSDYLEIEGGLRADDYIVVDGAGLIKDGDSVRTELASTGDGAAK